MGHRQKGKTPCQTTENQNGNRERTESIRLRQTATEGAKNDNRCLEMVNWGLLRGLQNGRGNGTKGHPHSKKRRILPGRRFRIPLGATQQASQTGMSKKTPDPLRINWLALAGLLSLIAVLAWGFPPTN